VKTQPYRRTWWSDSKSCRVESGSDEAAFRFFFLVLVLSPALNDLNRSGPLRSPSARSEILPRQRSGSRAAQP
jgi:hypothetical protein